MGEWSSLEAYGWTDYLPPQDITIQTHQDKAKIYLMITKPRGFEHKWRTRGYDTSLWIWASDSYNLSIIILMENDNALMIVTFSNISTMSQPTPPISLIILYAPSMKSHLLGLFCTCWIIRHLYSFRRIQWSFDIINSLFPQANVNLEIIGPNIFNKWNVLSDIREKLTNDMSVLYHAMVLVLPGIKPVPDPKLRTVLSPYITVS